MSRKVYPLNALRAFEAAARHSSFVKAAEELHVTPAAISRQVKTLEEFLDVQLFQRLPHGLVLNGAGESLLPELRKGFEYLENAISHICEPDTKGRLSISVAPIFATKWLAPRLETFNADYPEIDIRISAQLSLVDFQRENFDAAIRLGRGAYPGLESTKLFDECVTPLCSPRVLSRDHPIIGTKDLENHILLHDDSLCFDRTAPTWKSWLKTAGAPGIDVSKGPHFSHPDHALQAAIDGAGVVLGWRNLAASEIAAGRLIAPFDLTLPMGLGFYFVCPSHQANRPIIAAFRKWLLSECNSDASNDD